ncbi:MAG: hypothetical protein WA175_02120 [Candidatus Acidiferrales bacterium]
MQPKTSRAFLVCLALLCVQASFAEAQTAVPVEPLTASSTTAAPGAETALPTSVEILDKYEAATGGHDAWSRFKTRSTRGIYQSEDESTFAGIEILNESPNKMSTTITFPNGASIRETCDGKSAWAEDSGGNIHEFTGVQLESILRDSAFGNRAEVLRQMGPGRVSGISRVGTHSVYVVEFSPEKDISSKAFFDTDSGFIVRTDDTFHRPDGDHIVETDFDDYSTVDGAYFPFRMRHVERGNVFTVHVIQVKNNAPVDETVFEKAGAAPGEQ